MGGRTTGYVLSQLCSLSPSTDVLVDSCPVDIEEAELEAYAEEYEKMVSAENDSDAIWDEFDDDCFLDDESMDIS